MKNDFEPRLSMRKFRIDFEKEQTRLINLIQHRYIYIDTISILTREEVSASRLKMLRASSDSAISRWKSKYGWYTLLIQRPNFVVLSFIENFYPDHMVNRCDFAVDFIVASEEEAEELGNFFRRFLSMPWHGKRKVTDFEKTTYFASSWERRNIALYCDKLSKMSDEICVHLDFRWFSASVCKASMGTKIEQILRCDPVPLICRQSRLMALNWDAFKQVYDRLEESSVWRYCHKKPREWSAGGKTFERTPDQIRKRIRGIVARSLQTGGDTLTFSQLQDEAPIQAWLDLARAKKGNAFGKAIFKAVERFPIDPFFENVTFFPPLAPRRKPFLD